MKYRLLVGFGHLKVSVRSPAYETQAAISAHHRLSIAGLRGGVNVESGSNSLREQFIELFSFQPIDPRRGVAPR